MAPDEMDPFEKLRSAVQGGGSGTPPEPPNAATPDEPDDEGLEYPRCGTSPVDLAGQQVDLYDLQPYNWDEAPWETQPVSVRPVADESGRWRANVSWEAPELPADAVAVYRVLIGDEYRPDEECANVEETLVLTTECEAVDASWINQPEAPFRYYEVWCYCGDTIDKALQASPYPVGSCYLVWPPAALTAEVDHGQVLVSWDVGEDPARRFKIIRQDPREARAGVPRPEDAEFGDHGQFVDRDVQPGRKYVYTVFAGAEVDGHVEWSRHARTSVKVPAQLRPVLDLAIMPSDDGERVTLSWTNIPGAEVLVYRSQKRPALAAEEVGVIDKSDLAGRVLLAESDRLHHRPIVEHGRAWMRDVAIPPESTELHFTPVTAADHKCAPGRTLDWLRLRPPTDPFVEDRVDWILVVFAWPVGATEVLLYASDVGRSIDPATLQPLDRISYDDHRVFGGFRVDRSRFTAGTRDLHLVASRFARQKHFSDPVSVRHTFPALIRYAVATQTRFRATRSVLKITAAEDIRDVELKLGWNSQFLPVAPRDFERVLLRKTLNMKRGEPYPIDLSEQVPSMPVGGYLRLMSRPGLPIAVIDPSIDQLKL